MTEAPKVASLTKASTDLMKPFFRALLFLLNTGFMARKVFIRAFRALNNFYGRHLLQFELRLIARECLGVLVLLAPLRPPFAERRCGVAVRHERV